MKKIIMVLLAVLAVAVFHPTTSEAKVMHDGAEVVKGQTGKMTFTKDIKVYKKNPNGTFDSLVVKRNNFFRTYDIEKYDGKTFYQMGQYRVQATDLVVFKEVPLKIRTSFYQNPTYININRENGNYGRYFRKEPTWSIVFKDSVNGQILEYCDGENDGTYDPCRRYLGTDLKIADTIVREEMRYELMENTIGKHAPLKEAKPDIMYEKGTIFVTNGPIINGYVLVLATGKGYDVWLPDNLLKQVGDK
ncbi:MULTISPECIES: hypothetical protein [unclassified Lysinibacillus]|uniref:hypothetical protein n=1 Tax=unclassified Lysinibacillus TaxID=2636778 RepID=UPI003801F1CE